MHTITVPRAPFGTSRNRLSDALRQFQAAKDARRNGLDAEAWEAFEEAEYLALEALRDLNACQSSVDRTAQLMAAE